MSNDETLPETTNTDLDEMRQLRVKVSVRVLVNLQYFRLTQSRGISEIVNEALTEYFSGLDPKVAQAEPSVRIHGGRPQAPALAPTLRLRDAVSEPG